MTKAAILATFADWRTVKGRKVLQLIFEVPLEDQAKVLTHLGAPMPMSEMWCGIARVTQEGKAEGDATGGTNVKPDTPPARFKQRWSDLRPSARAALLTKDPEFQGYTKRFGYDGTEAGANDFLKAKTNIDSKAELDEPQNEPNRNMFAHMESSYRAWQQARAHGAA